MTTLTARVGKLDRPVDPIDPFAPVIPPHRLLDQEIHVPISVFSDKRWNLAPGIAAPNVSASLQFMDYTDYPEDLRDLVWTFSWLAMNFDHHQLPVRLGAVSPARIKKEARALVRYCQFLQTRGVSLHSVRDDDNDAWMALFKDNHYSGRVRAAAIPKRLYWYRRYFPRFAPEQMPWKSRSPTEVLGNTPSISDNTTERVPRSVLEPLFRWALFYIDHAYSDIFTRVQNGGGQTADEYALLPGTAVHWRSSPRFNERVVDEPHYLVTACYIITAYLSGMRDAEVSSIEPGWKKVLRDENGEPYRHLVRATAFKGQKVSSGRKRTWIVLPEVHRALERLEELAEIMNLHVTKWGPMQFGRHLFRRFGAIRSNVATITDMTTWLNRFQAHVAQLAQEAADRAPSADERRRVLDLYAIPPTAEGSPWRLTTKQFRRTVAWYIANEPFGTVAGKRQYGHIRETTFQGYAGTADAGFRDEIEMARATGQMRDIIQMYEDVMEGATLGGPKGTVLEREFHRISRQLGDIPGKVVSEDRLAGMLKNVAKEVYPGLLNDCFFDASTALCLRGSHIKDRSHPNFLYCNLEKCPNSCLTRKHASSLERSLDDALSYRKRRNLSKNQRSVLDKSIAMYSGALEKITRAR